MSESLHNLIKANADFTQPYSRGILMPDLCTIYLFMLVLAEMRFLMLGFRMPFFILLSL
jgi:hypothetical protein